MSNMPANRASELAFEYLHSLREQKRNSEAARFELEIACLGHYTETNVRNVIKRFDQGLAL